MEPQQIKKSIPNQKYLLENLYYHTLRNAQNTYRVGGLTRRSRLVGVWMRLWFGWIGWYWVVCW